MNNMKKRLSSKKKFKWMPEPLRGLLLTLGHIELAGSEHVTPYVRDTKSLQMPANNEISR